jgi:hypothetical protein
LGWDSALNIFLQDIEKNSKSPVPIDE